MNRLRRPSFAAPTASWVALAVVAMAAVVLASNILVQHAVEGPLRDWLTWGAFTYPV
ncbi:MAG: VUT family protein, partial [Comamonadaceae bacterium]